MCPAEGSLVTATLCKHLPWFQSWLFCPFVVIQLGKDLVSSIKSHPNGTSVFRVRAGWNKTFTSTKNCRRSSGGNQFSLPPARPPALKEQTGCLHNPCNITHTHTQGLCWSQTWRRCRCGWKWTVIISYWLSSASWWPACRRKDPCWCLLCGKRRKKGTDHW